MKRVYLFLIVGLLLSVIPCEAKKVKNSFIIEKSAKTKESKEGNIKGKEINLQHGEIEEEESSVSFPVTFAGYDKELTSNNESFLVVNDSDEVITGFKVKIEYLDMQGRMLHSREVRMACEIPPGETRRFDIKSWDLQRTYYYYLGNEPKKVATPYQVRFIPQYVYVL